MDSSPALEERIRTLAARFERFSRHIARCEVIVEPLPGHQHHGGRFQVRIGITLPDKQLTIQGAHVQAPRHQDVYVALHDAFRAARRQLEDYERIRRRDVKRHSM